MDDVVKDWGDENAVKAENGAEADRITNVEGASSHGGNNAGLSIPEIEVFYMLFDRYLSIF